MNPEEILRLPHRVLVIDDNPRIHEDIRKIVNSAGDDAITDELADEAAILFNEAARPIPEAALDIIIDSAHQGEEGLAMVRKAMAEERPYMMAFVDMRMPPGWDGLETIQQIWQVYPALQIVICTAYSDRPWEEINAKLGRTANLLILKKPFDNMEVLQLIQTLTQKWIVTQIADYQMGQMEVAVEERSYELIQTRDELGLAVQHRSESQDAWLEAEEKFRTVFESGWAAQAIVSEDSLEHTVVNKSYLELLDLRRADVIGHTLSELNLSEDLGGLGKALAEHRAGRPVHDLEIELRRTHLPRCRARISITPMRLGKLNFLLFAMQEIRAMQLVELIS